MWLEPIKYSVNVGEKIFINEVVGQNFKGNKYGYLDTSYKSLKITIADNINDIKSRLGDLPAIQYTAKKQGLHVITAETSSADLTYDSKEKFVQFLNEEGLDWVFAEHKKRNLPDSGFTERFHRSAKTLVAVGHGKGKDRLLGLPLEWVVETNPYNSAGNIKARLYWQGKPAAAMHVNVFNKPEGSLVDSDLIEIKLKTDSYGRIEIPRANGGSFLLNSVKMIEHTDTKDAVWESIWGSLSYQILSKN